MTCPTCGSSDVDIFLPLVPDMLCDNPFHEDRLIKKTRVNPPEAASRQTFWPAGFTATYVAGNSEYAQRATEAAIRSVNEMAKNLRDRDEGKI